MPYILLTPDLDSNTDTDIDLSIDEAKQKTGMISADSLKIKALPSQWIPQLKRHTQNRRLSLSQPITLHGIRDFVVRGR